MSINRHDGGHCFHPDLERAPIYVDVESGEVHRLMLVTRESDLYYVETCCRCKLRRTRRWVFSRKPNEAHPDVPHYEDASTPLTTLCSPK